jgi:microsomal dipeptidase-like Zn-dependent dipeptidase
MISLLVALLQASLPLVTLQASTWATTRNDFCDMVEWSVGKFPIDAVGFGTDYYPDYSEDAIAWWRAGRWARQSPLRSPNKLSSWDDWFRSPEDFPDLLEELGKRSFSESDIAKISGGNWLRLYKESFAPR